MAKNLVIVESPAKAKTINKFLGKDYIVKASMGHVRDLPKKELGVDPEKGFEPKYVSIKDKQKVLKELRADAKKVDQIFLAPDPDREGEAIAWHLFEALRRGIPDEHFHRVTYNEITKPAILEAFSHPGPIDKNRVDAQQARRVLDRIVGYKVSPILWRSIRGGQSAGRVQSVALRLVCEREDLINNFKPEEYWLLGAKVRKQKDPLDPFEIRLARVNGDKAEITNEAQAASVLDALKERPIKVTGVNRRELKKKPQAPFITSTLQQAGSRFHGFTPSRTMKIAQGLYEGVDFGEGPVGLITYMRTDSVAVSKSAQEECRTFIGEKYGSDYIPAKPNFFKSRGSAQEAHEAIRPTSAMRTPKELASVLKPDELKLYTVIWNRFVASQMAPAVIAQRTVEFTAVSNDEKTSALFRASTSDVIFPGYMKVMAADDKKQAQQEKLEKGQQEEEAEQKLPELEEGEEVDLLDWLSEQKFTQPPGRYTEASLVRALEENGVGRPSTYAQILYVLVNRKYVDKEKRSLRPTPSGMRVNEFLVEHLPDLFDIGFTADMEAKLDSIESGEVDWTGMLSDFYSKFVVWLEKAKGPDATPEEVTPLLDLTDQVKEWKPPVKRGKRTYSDEKYVQTLRKQIEDGKKPVSARQFLALKKMLCTYREQIPEVTSKTAELGLEKVLEEALKPKEPPRECTQKKLGLLAPLSFDEPRKVGKRTYDDKEFYLSLNQQVEEGKRLSPNQIKYLDRLVVKYSDQIPDFEKLREELDLDKPEEGVSAEQITPVFELFEQVKEWNDPVQRGKRTWDDKEFFNSLDSQFKKKKSLSEKQFASLKKMAVRYADQIKDYEAEAEKLGLPLPKKKKASAES